MAEWSAFRPLAARAGTAPVAPGALRVFPNPDGAAVATVQLPAPSRAGGTLAVFDPLDRCCARQVVPPGATALPVALGQLPAGLYLLRYEGRDSLQLTTRLVRE